MIGYLEGKLVGITPTFTYMDVNGVGYEIQISLHTYQKISELQETKLFTHLQVREDGWTLYGFASLAEKEAFVKLIAINGIGANTARVMLSALTPEELYKIIAAGDSKPLEKIKGIGSKTAQRIILELKGKIDINTLTQDLDTVPHNTLDQDALYALIGLGIAKNTAEAALRKVDTSIHHAVEARIKEALKNL